VHLLQGSSTNESRVFCTKQKKKKNLSRKFFLKPSIVRVRIVAATNSALTWRAVGTQCFSMQRASGSRSMVHKSDSASDFILPLSNTHVGPQTHLTINTTEHTCGTTNTLDNQHNGKVVFCCRLTSVGTDAVGSLVEGCAVQHGGMNLDIMDACMLIQHQQHSSQICNARVSMPGLVQDVPFRLQVGCQLCSG